MKINIFCTVVQQVTHQVDPEKVKELGLDLQLFIKHSFPWAAIIPSVHVMASHYWELIEINGKKPIGVYSEQGSEAMNKFIRAYKSGVSCRARQINIKVNTQDVFKRMWLRSHPLVALQRRVLQCTKCNSSGHTVRSCPARFETVSDYELSVINACYLD